MIDMKRTAEEAQEDCCAPICLPQYPYGLLLNLKKCDLIKLGITQIPTVGNEFNITCEATVSSVNSQDLGEDDISVSLQITEMEMSIEKVEDDSDEPAEPKGGSLMQMEY